MNFLQPNAVPGVIEAGTDHKTKRVNIVHFLRAVQAYGVPRQLLFEPEDLLYLRHVPKVTRCLYALGKAVSLSSLLELHRMIEASEDSSEKPALGKREDSNI